MKEELKDKKILVIVESPKKVHSIQEYIKAAGYNVRTMASAGHIMELANGGSYYNTGIEPTKDFEMDIRVSDTRKDTVKNLKANVDWADIVYLMTDPDREGFVISWSLIKFLKLAKNKYKRAVTHEIKPKAVVNAIENPIEMDDNLVDAGLARLALDKIIGYRLSPLARTILNAKSVGRCQSVGLKLVADRENEIKNFKSNTYFDLYLNFVKNKAGFKAKYIGTDTETIDHLKSQEEVDKVRASCNADYIIKSIDKREKLDNPKPPFCTLDFQAEVASKIGLSIKDAMSIAQSLFEAGNITYIRTDDTDMSPEFIETLRPYIMSNYGKESWNEPRKAKKQETAQSGHECLRITDPELTPELFNKMNKNELQQKVYRIVWQRTIASCLPSAIISETKYNIYNNDQKFILVSNEVISEGYRVVYNYKDDDSEDEETIKETFKKDEILHETELEDVKKETTPPARYKENTLVKALKKHEIGRPSTTATIIETVLSSTRGYAELDKKKFIVPTDKGMQLAEFLDKNFSDIINLNYTRDMEKNLDKIASGKMTKLDFLTNFHADLENTIKNNKNLSAIGQPSDKVCPKCGKPLVVRKGKFGLFLGCSGYPACKYLESLNKK